MRIAYALEDAGLSGGARVVLEHCNRLAARGHNITLFTVTASKPNNWFDVRNIEHVSTGSYAALGKWLQTFDGPKIATWWRTAQVVSDAPGMNFYMVQDIESSYATNKRESADILATYQLPLTQLVEGRWVSEALPDSRYIGIGLDHNLYKPTGVFRASNTVLYLYRRHFLKGVELFDTAITYLPKHYRIVTCGLERPPTKRVDHQGCVTDAALADYYNRAGVYVSTSQHEGFGLPILEAMACGCPVVTTNADGNMEFCVDGYNCLMVERDPIALAQAIESLCRDQAMAETLASAGQATTRRYQWDTVINNLVSVLAKDR